MDSDTDTPTSPIAIIAGAGRFPMLIAQEIKRQGKPVIALGIQGWVDPSLSAHVDTYDEIEMGKLGALVDRMKAYKVRQAIMAGKVTKEILVKSSVEFDADMKRLLQDVKDVSANSLLGKIADYLACEGITLLDSSAFLGSSLCPAGVLTKRAPSDQEKKDISYGIQIARALALFDVGQTVVIKREVIVAVEALEGTDAAIRRAGKLSGPGLVVVKAASPNQDMRFDIPVLGCDSIDVLRQSGVSCVAAQVGRTLLLDKHSLIAGANEANLCLVGVEIDSAKPS